MTTRVWMGGESNSCREDRIYAPYYPAHAGYPSIKKGGESAKPATNRKRTFITALNLKNITTKWTLLTPD